MLSHHEKQLMYAAKQDWFPDFINSALNSSISYGVVNSKNSIINSFLWSDNYLLYDKWVNLNNILIDYYKVQEYDKDKSTPIADIILYITTNYPINKYPEYYI